MLHRRNVPALRTIAALNHAPNAPKQSHAQETATACWKNVLETACALDSTTDLDALSAHVEACYSLLASHPQLSTHAQHNVQRSALQLIDFFALLKEAKALTCVTAKPR